MSTGIPEEIMTFGKELEKLACSKGLYTQKEIADACGLTQGYVSRLFNGVCSPSGAVMVQLWLVLGTDMQFFAKHIGGKKGKPR